MHEESEKNQPGVSMVVGARGISGRTPFISMRVGFQGACSSWDAQVPQLPAWRAQRTRRVGSGEIRDLWGPTLFINACGTSSSLFTHVPVELCLVCGNVTGRNVRPLKMWVSSWSWTRPLSHMAEITHRHLRVAQTRCCVCGCPQNCGLHPRRTNGTLQEGHLRASRACRLPQCRHNPASQTPRSSLVIILMNSFKLILPSPSTSASAIHALTVSSSTGPSPIVVRASTSSSRSR